MEVQQLGSEEDKITKGKTYKVLPLTLSLETLGGVATPLVLRGTILPAKRSQVFSTASDDQESVEVSLFFGESPLVEKNRNIGKFTLKGIPKAKRGVAQIMVTFEVDTRLKIRASAIGQKSQEKMVVEFDGGQAELSDDEVKEILAKCEASKLEDEKILKAIEAKNKANSIIEEAENRIRTNQENGTSTTQDKQIERLLASLGLALEKDDMSEIKENVEKLEKIIYSFSGNSDIFDMFFKQPSPVSKPIHKQQSTPQSTNPKSTKPKTSHPEQITTSKMKVAQYGKIFGGGEFNIDPNLCFVLMQFNESMNPVYDDHIKPIVKSHGLACLRADEVLGLSSITSDIWEKINRARLLIADMTHKNPNVFYELGLAHALGKDVILLTQSMDYVPFDLKSLRCIVYSYDPRGVKKLEEQLGATIKYIIQTS